MLRYPVIANLWVHKWVFRISYVRQVRLTCGSLGYSLSEASFDISRVAQSGIVIAFSQARFECSMSVSFSVGHEVSIIRLEVTIQIPFELALPHPEALSICKTLIHIVILLCGAYKLCRWCVARCCRKTIAPAVGDVCQDDGVIYTTECGQALHFVSHCSYVERARTRNTLKTYSIRCSECNRRCSRGER